MFTRIALASFLAIAVLNGCATKKEPAPDPEAAAAAARAEEAAKKLFNSIAEDVLARIDELKR